MASRPPPRGSHKHYSPVPTVDVEMSGEMRVQLSSEGSSVRGGGMSPHHDVHGELLMPNAPESEDARRKWIRWSLYFFFATFQLGLVTYAYDIATAMDAESASEEADKVEEIAEHQRELNKQHSLGHDKARMCIIVGFVGLALTLATAAAHGELQRWLSRERKLSRCLGQVMTLVYITTCVCFPYMVYVGFFILRMRPHDVAWIAAAIFTMMTVILSGREIRLHLVNYSSPRVQKHIVRILWMPPIYAFNCFMAMRFDSIAVYLTVVRELYEAYCVWSFMALMIEFLHNVATYKNNAAGMVSVSPEERDALRAEFDRFDTSGDGYIDLDEVGRLFQQLGIRLTRAELQDVIGGFIKDGEDQLGREEFLQVMATRMTDQGEQEAFAALDKDNSGTLVVAEFIEVVMNMGFDVQEAHGLVALAFSDGDTPIPATTEITKQQFQTILHANAVFRVRIGFLQRMGALWALARANQGNTDASDIRYRDVARMLERAAEEARAAAQDDTGAAQGHGHGDSASDGCGCCEPAPCDVGEHPHMPPFHKAKAWRQGTEFLHKCRVGVLQYVACQTFASIFAFISQKRGSFHEGSFDPRYGYFWVAALKTVSQGTALYCLVYFEHSCAEFLKPIKPMPKFWSIKLVVMATFWQAITISILTFYDMMPWETIYSQCYVNAAGESALDRMTNPLYQHDNLHSCVDDPVCTTGKYLAVFATFGGSPCLEGWNTTVVNLVASNHELFGLKTSVDELDQLCSQSCLSSEYCRNPQDNCHPWCLDYKEGLTNFFGPDFFCANDHTDTSHSRSTFDFCAKDQERQGMSEHEAEEEASSVCYSTFNDDIGNFEKFSEKANVHLQNLLVTFEMFLAALAHRVVFSYRDFKSGTKKTLAAGLRDMIPREVARDVRNLTVKTARKQATNLVGAEAVERADSILDTVEERRKNAVKEVRAAADEVVATLDRVATGGTD